MTVLLQGVSVKRILRSLGVACAVFLIGSAVLATPASAQGKTVQVDWTGIGIYPQAAPRFHSGEAGKALPDKAYVTIVCEAFGESVSNGLETSDVWAQISSGGYLPTAFLNTGVNGRTPGVDDCNVEPTKPAPPRGEISSFRKSYDNTGVAVDAFYWRSSGRNFVLPKTTDTVVAWTLDDSHYNLSVPLYNYWNSAKGGTVLVPWDYFAAQPGFTDWLNNTSFTLYSAGASGEKVYEPSITTDMKFAVGSVLVFKLSEGCYILTDSYEFDPDKVANWPYYAEYLGEKSGKGGKRFGVAATNC